MKKLVFALLLAVLLVLGLLPSAALAYDSGGVTYNDHDIAAVSTFLNGDSATSGQKNWEALGYTVSDPATWTGVTWTTVGSEQRIQTIDWHGAGIAGMLDVADCTSLTSLNINNCASITELYCLQCNVLASLNVSGCSGLTRLYCYTNALTSLDISGLASLTYLNCNGNSLSELKAVGCTGLQTLYCMNNSLSTLDVSDSTSINTFNITGNPWAQIKANIGGQAVTVAANGNGTVNLSGAPNSLTAWSSAKSPSVFVEWTEGGSQVSTAEIYSIPATGGHTLTANFASYITYDDNGAYVGAPPTDSTPHIPGESVTLPGNDGYLEKTACYFIGWNTKDDYTGTHYDAGAEYTMPDGPVTLYVQWEPQDYSVVYTPNAATFTGSAPTDANAYHMGDTVTVLGNTGNLERPGYTFTGWNRTVDGSGTHYNAGQTFTMPGNVTLYADWKQNFTVMYNSNGATGGSVPAVATFYEGQAATLPGNTGGLAKTGYVFSGWNTQTNGSGTHYAVGSTFTMPKSNVVLYAEWKVNYNAHDTAKIQAFLAQGANAAALGADINAPGAWTGVTWAQSGNEWYVQKIEWPGKSLWGTLDVSDCKALQLVDVHTNNLSGVVVNGCTALKAICCFQNRIPSINVAWLSGLQYLDVGENSITSLNLLGLTSLVELYCDHNSLGSLDVNGCPNLEALGCSYCSLASLNINGCNELVLLDCSYNNLPSLNTSQVFVYFDCRDNPMTQVSLRLPGKYGIVPISFTASGPGYVGFFYDAIQTGTIRAEATAINAVDFTGWTKDGASFSSSANCDITQGGAYVASFAYNKGPLLSNVGLSAGSISPAFSPSVYKYNVMLGENDQGVTITPEKMFYGLGMTINKQNVPSLWVPVTAGKSAKVSVVVTLGKTKNTYMFTVTRPKTSNNYLSSLTATAGSWSQGFDPNVMNYTLYLDENTKGTAIKAAAVPGFGAKVSPASAKVSLNNGAFKDVKITVKAQSGAKRVYTIHVVRAAATNANLKSLKAPGLTPGFNAAQTNYTVTLAANKSSISISAKAAGYKATVSINGGKASAKLTLANGETKIVRVVVTSQAGSTKEYLITVTRQ